ncbi:uncharacterized protein LOC130648647 [Hydractinia symbiolongicarpus]|uniref:uncharacterized protein LOC130621417 n=1 Tax=Hydractinia symbiolongicarpus TaxID=13093 RepID=UPI0025509631|nr:uncharacterized protein LOC130621417 [Hydractinia symbiolongicarpus]XP_057294530.1 uncharacterized protein LOC130623041 [Hydractinia symbiolongicarpus]XP_057310685.1 uncharacterized protein LOC130648647 [Hydractinia symbiolongicarpus]
MEVENIVLNSVKEIHRRKKKADYDSIVTNTKDLHPEIIEQTLKDLCQQNILNKTERNGTESYLFVKQVEEEKENSTDESFSEEKKDVVDDLIEDKKFISYKLSKIGDNSSNILIKQLRSEIDFLKEEIKDYKKLVSEILNSNQRDHSVETCKHVEPIKQHNQWNNVIKGPSRFSTNKVNRNEELHHNRFNDLRVEVNDDSNQQSWGDQDCNFTKESQNTHHVDVNNHIRSSNIFKNNVTHRRRPNPVINPFPERDQLATNLEHQNVHHSKKIRIMTDSIPKGIRVKEFNEQIKNGNVRFKIFPGASVENLNYYVQPTLEQEKPDIVVIHVGINNLLSSHLNAASDNKIAEQILDIGKKCVQKDPIYTVMATSDTTISEKNTYGKMAYIYERMISRGIQ